MPVLLLLHVPPVVASLSVNVCPAHTVLLLPVIADGIGLTTIGMVALHADAVAQKGATGVGTCGIDRDDANGLLSIAVVAGEMIDERAPPGGGRA